MGERNDQDVESWQPYSLFLSSIGFTLSRPHPIETHIPLVGKEWGEAEEAYGRIELVVTTLAFFKVADPIFAIVCFIT